MPLRLDFLRGLISKNGGPRTRVVSNGDRLRWPVFGGMGISAMVTIVMGMGTGTQERSPWDWKYISYAVIGFEPAPTVLTL